MCSYNWPQAQRHNSVATVYNPIATIFLDTVVQKCARFKHTKKKMFCCAKKRGCVGADSYYSLDQMPVCILDGVASFLNVSEFSEFLLISHAVQVYLEYTTNYTLFFY